MPTHTPPLPPQVSTIHATGFNGSIYASPIEIPEGPLEYKPPARFNMDDDEDLYGEMPSSAGGKGVERSMEKGKNDNCSVQ